MEERKTYFQTWLDKNIPKKKQNLSVQFFDNFFENMLVNSSHPRENANLELFGLNKYLDEKHSKEDIAIAEVYKIRLEAFLQGMDMGKNELEKQRQFNEKMALLLIGSLIGFLFTLLGVFLL